MWGSKHRSLRQIMLNNELTPVVVVVGLWNTYLHFDSSTSFFKFITIMFLKELARWLWHVNSHGWGPLIISDQLSLNNIIIVSSLTYASRCSPYARQCWWCPRRGSTAASVSRPPRHNRDLEENEGIFSKYLGVPWNDKTWLKSTWMYAHSNLKLVAWFVSHFEFPGTFDQCKGCFCDFYHVTVTWNSEINKIKIKRLKLNLNNLTDHFVQGVLRLACRRHR